LKAKLLQIARFLIAGGVTVLVYYGILYSLTEFIELWYLISSLVAFLVYVGMNFLIQKYWTFKNSDRKNLKQQLKKYFTVMISLFVINTIALYSLVECLHLKYLIPQFFLTLFLSVLSFRVTKWIFVAK
jgi:putative flippase GtrA